MRERERQNPVGRFATLTVVRDADIDPAMDRVRVGEERAKSILSENDSPDLGFRWSANPYRGCVHACAYCYARPSHEYLELGAGTDFDTKLLIKRDAAALLRAAFDRPSWQGELVMWSGITDCYQPIEAKYGLTRACLQVCAEYRNPVGVITKGTLVERDIDVLVELGRVAWAGVSVSLAFRDDDTARALEPWAPAPSRRLRVIETLAKAGVPVGIMMAPIIPGLSDDGIVELLERARDAGAQWAGMSLLRLPGTVKQVFEERVRAAMPLAADKILGRIRDTQGGALYDSRYGVRGRGMGAYAAAITQLFEQTRARLGYTAHGRHARTDTFQRPLRRGPQLSLF